jgi:hypothetical protein
MGSPLIAYKMEIWSEETPIGVDNLQLFKQNLGI